MITVAETELQVNNQSVQSPIVVFDQPHRSFIVVLDEEPQTVDTNSRHTRVMAFEGVHYKGGTVRLFNNTYLDGPKRAIVMVLDEVPKVPTTELPKADQPMKDPIQVGNLLFDLDQAFEIGDMGDHIFINFGVLHQPPLLILTGEKADQFRALGLELPAASHKYLSEEELSSVRQKIAQNKGGDQSTILRLVEDVRALRENRRELLDTVGRTFQGQIES